MAEIRVREVHPHVVARLNEIAKSKSISREELLRRVLEHYTLSDLLRNQESELSAKVDNLNTLLIAHLDKTNEVFKLIETEVENEYE